MNDCEYCGDATDPEEMCRKCLLVVVGAAIVEATPRRAP